MIELHQCQNCEKNWPEDELREIKHLEQRVLPGEIMPSGECPECGAVCHPLTTDNVGNQFSHVCPKCKQGDRLAINAHVWVNLLPDGTEENEDRGDTEWDNSDPAWCQACEWEGKVCELLTLELEEGETEDASPELS